MTSPAGTMRPSLDAALARFIRPIEDTLGPITHAPVTHPTPAYIATCLSQPGVACPKCGATCDAPCRTCTGRECDDHKGRGRTA